MSVLAESRKREPAMCEVCNAPMMIYWLKNDVWREIDPTGKRILCPTCAEAQLGRELTLHDLDIANYKAKGTMHFAPGFMKEYTRAAIVGGFLAASEHLPAGWTVPSDHPHIDHMSIGEKLGRQTADLTDVLPKLVAELDRVFPT